MINKTLLDLMVEEEGSLMIPAEDVSMVFEDNSLLHAIMILNNTTYISVPVLDYDNKLKGIISTSQIIKFLGEKILGGFDVLEEYKVKDALLDNYSTIKEDYTIEEAMRALINHNFLCVIDDDGVLKGIIPRSNLLKKFNYMAHEFDKRYYVTNKKQFPFFF